MKVILPLLAFLCVGAVSMAGLAASQPSGPAVAEMALRGDAQDAPVILDAIEALLAAPESESEAKLLMITYVRALVRQCTLLDLTSANQKRMTDMATRLQLQDALMFAADCPQLENSRP